MKKQTRAILVIGLGYGDEGKGKIVDFLSRNENVHTVVRFSGGAQAAHNVVTFDGKHHTFAQFGSGSLVPGIETHLSKHMLVNPILLLSEAEHLYELGTANVFKKITVHEDALITTPFQMAANRLRELARHNARHGSCGLGIGETVQDHVDNGDKVIFARDLRDPKKLEQKLRFMQTIKREQLYPLVGKLEISEAICRELDILEDTREINRCLKRFARFAKRIRIVSDDYLASRLQKPGTVIFEGSQGVLLDEKYGFFPYCTRSNVTFENAQKLLDEAGFQGKVTKLGVLRTYATRHGAGPFVTEDESLRPHLPELHNAYGDWQQSFRIGHFDMVAAEYAIHAVGGVDAIALTHVDYLDSCQELKFCSAYKWDKQDAKQFEWHSYGIKAQPDTTLKRQAQMTKALERVRPIYRPFDDDREGAIHTIELILKTPITLISTGNIALYTMYRNSKIHQ